MTVSLFKVVDLLQAAKSSFNYEIYAIAYLGEKKKLKRWVSSTTRLDQPIDRSLRKLYQQPCR